jgi:16S rRNA (guanine527-N7)-methyltransferase
MAPNPADEVLERFNVSRESRVRLNIYVSVLLNWQKQINLIGPSTVDQVWTRHIADSLRLIGLLPPATRTMADLGSGAGVPGLILAIATGHKVHLYESNGKKAAFLRETVRQTSAAATVHQIRSELLASDPARPKVDVVLARAFAPLGRLLSHAAPFLADGAVGLFHKGQDIDAELTDATKCWRIRYIKHSGVIDSNGVILEVREAIRVQP